MRNRNKSIAVIAIVPALLASLLDTAATHPNIAVSDSTKSIGSPLSTVLTEDFNDLSEWNVYYDCGGLPPVVTDGKLIVTYPPKLTSGYFAETYLLSRKSFLVESTLVLEFMSATDKNIYSTDNRNEFSCFMVSDTTKWKGKEFGIIFSLKDDCKTIRPYIQLNGDAWITPEPVDVGNLTRFKHFKAIAKIQGESVLFKWYVDGKLISSYALVDSGWSTTFKAAIVTHNWGIICPPTSITYDNLSVMIYSQH
jgi:hypothetical protein